MAVELAIGKMNRKAIFRAPVTAQNAEGGRSTSYPADTLTEYVFVRERSQFRTTEALVTTLTSTKEIYVRYHTGSAAISKDWQVEYDGLKYMIHAIEKVEQKNQYLRISLEGHG